MNHKYMIGNWVFDEDGTPIQVDTIWEDGINYVEGHIHGIKFEDIRPIPLSEEWFKRMDFIDGDIESLEDFWDEIQAHMYSDITYDKCDNGLLMYVHQAQNIYELLTQKELKIKE